MKIQIFCANNMIISVTVLTNADKQYLIEVIKEAILAKVTRTSLLGLITLAT